MVLHAVKKIPKATWTNDRDAFYAPNGCALGDRALPDEFVTDSVVWSAFADSNYAVSLRNVEYQGHVWQIANQMYPFLLDEVRQWQCAHSDIAAQLAAANEDRFLAKWLKEHKLSSEAHAVLNAARELYREFYANMTHTPWMDWKIETWDVGFYQVRNAMKNYSASSAPSRLCVESNPLADLRTVHNALRMKLLPQIYTLGFLNPDVEYFK